MAVSMIGFTGIILGDCIDVMRRMPENSVDALVTDPPYGWRFMGKAWDGEFMGCNGNYAFQEWTTLWAREALRVLKPGAHALIFCGPRTYHRMASGVEDAGFEVRDQMQWLFGSGFPKSLDVSKAIDKAAGAEREVIGSYKATGTARTMTGNNYGGGGNNVNETDRIYQTAPATPDAQRWQGWGTALKPSNEPILLARKPLSEDTVAKNVLKWGTGAIHVDACRIGTQTITQHGRSGSENVAMSGRNYTEASGRSWTGRFPANTLFDEGAAAMLDRQTGTLKAGVAGKKSRPYGGGQIYGTMKEFKPNGTEGYADSGGASRFFYCAKASKSERNAGCEGLPEKDAPKFDGGDFIRGENNNAKDQRSHNHHPTVKPLRLMRYLVRLVTPPQGVVLDPFLGSGTTALAAQAEGFHFVGIEREAEYVEIAQKRITSLSAP